MLKTLGITVVLPAFTFGVTLGLISPSKVIPNLGILSPISEAVGEENRVSEKKSGGISKQTPRRPDAQTRRIEIPTKISLTQENKEKDTTLNPNHNLRLASLKQEVTEAENKDNFQHLMEVAIARHLHQLSIGEIIQAIAEEFLGKAYKAGLLDKSAQETLTISLTEFDCMLFVETVLAIARGLARQDYSYQTFTNHIRSQRYLNGQLDGYCSRLHYFSVWINDNQKRGTIKNIVPELGGMSLNKKLNFMSRHRYKYPRLLDNDRNYQCIVEMEANLDSVSIDYIPHSQIRNVYSLLQPGDIIGIATNISGLDVTHTGLVYHLPDGNIGFIHASPIGEVTIARDLQRYVGNVNNAIGILVARPIDPRFLSTANQ